MPTINRRQFLGRSALASAAIGLTENLWGQSVEGAHPAPVESVLPGTSALSAEGDMAAQMVEGIHRFLLHRTEEAARERPSLWNRDYASPAAYERSISPSRERFRRIIGAVDERVPPQAPDLIGTLSEPALIAKTSAYNIFTVRWSVLAPVTADFGSLEAEGLLLQPSAEPVARVVAIPDADWTPEMVAGVVPGIPPAAQFAKRLAENNCEVIVPLIINREDAFSGIPGIRMTNQPHREWIYRMAYEVGRHIIGFEVQKILAAVDWFVRENTRRSVPVGVMGYGEGGLLALYSAALDSRISATLVSGYFQEREEVWKEPIYRDVWGLEITGPPEATKEHQQGACPNGRLVSPPLDSVKREFDRARPFFRGLRAEGGLQLVVSGEAHGLPGSDGALRLFLRSLGSDIELLPAGSLSRADRRDYDSTARLRRQFDQLVGFSQALIRKAPDRRKQFWAKADASSPERWKETTKFYRDYLWEEVLGRLPAASLPPNPRTRLIFDEPTFKGYEVMLDVWPDVFDYGIILIPKNLKGLERRPVVVCQHGLEGTPRDVADPKIDNEFYHRFAVRLAEAGFVTYAPQNPCIGHDNFRLIQRLGHPLKLALYSFILGQHEQMLNWLASLPFVDPERIAYYGLSYGGRTAVRVPPLLSRYCLSICAADFVESDWRTTNVVSSQTYLLGPSYDAIEFDACNVANYSEMANLIAPRPFMVERGHNDSVSPDEWVAHEYAKVRRFYDLIGLHDKTEIEFFNGPHTIHGLKSFEFLRQHLSWPERFT